MKRVLFCEVVIQIIVIICLSISIIPKYKFIKLFYNNAVYVNILPSNEKAFEDFLLWADSNKVLVEKVIFNSDNDITIYMNSEAMKKELRLVSGKYPEKGEFLCETASDNAYQSGVIRKLLPNYTIKVYELSAPTDYKFSNLYILKPRSSDSPSEMISKLSIDDLQLEVTNIWEKATFSLLISQYSRGDLLSFFIYIISSVLLLIISILFRKTPSQKVYKNKKSICVKLNTIFACIVLSITYILFCFLSIITVISLRTYIDTYNSGKENRKLWSKSQNIYKICMKDIGQDMNLDIEVNLHRKAELLYRNLSENNIAFFVDVEDAYIYEKYTGNAPLTGLVTDGFYTHITVSPNYFKYNPIYTCDNDSVDNAIIYKDNVLNILVPQDLMYLESELKEQFADYFHYYRYEIYDSIYKSSSEDSWNISSAEELMVNLIPVQSNQSYFSYSDYLFSDADNSIKDPVVVVFTDNFHPSSIFAMSSRCLYFEYNDTQNMTVNDYLCSLIGLDGFVYAESIWNNYMETIRQSTKNVIIGMCLTLFMSVAIGICNYLFCVSLHGISTNSKDKEKNCKYYHKTINLGILGILNILALFFYVTMKNSKLRFFLPDNTTIEIVMLLLLLFIINILCNIYVFRRSDLGRTVENDRYSY